MRTFLFEDDAELRRLWKSTSKDDPIRVPAPSDGVGVFLKGPTRAIPSPRRFRAPWRRVVEAAGAGIVERLGALSHAAADRSAQTAVLFKLRVLRPDRHDDTYWPTALAALVVLGLVAEFSAWNGLGDDPDLRLSVRPANFGDFSHFQSEMANLAAAPQLDFGMIDSSDPAALLAYNRPNGRGNRDRDDKQVLVDAKDAELDLEAPAEGENLSATLGPGLGGAFFSLAGAPDIPGSGPGEEGNPPPTHTPASVPDKGSTLLLLTTGFALLAIIKQWRFGRPAVRDG